MQNKTSTSLCRLLRREIRRMPHASNFLLGGTSIHAGEKPESRSPKIDSAGISSVANWSGASRTQRGRFAARAREMKRLIGMKVMECGGKRGVEGKTARITNVVKTERPEEGVCSAHELIIELRLPSHLIFSCQEWTDRLVDSISLPSGPRLILFSYFPSLFLQYSYSISGIVSSCISVIPRGSTRVWGADLSWAVPIQQTPCFPARKPGSLGATVHTDTHKHSDIRPFQPNSTQRKKQTVASQTDTDRMRKCPTLSRRGKRC